MTHQHIELPAQFMDITRVTKQGERVKLRCEHTHLNALAQAIGVLALKSFHADLSAKAWSAEGMRLTGRLRATVEQACRVTLEPVVETLDLEMDRRFLPKEKGRSYEPSIVDGEMVLDPQEDPPDLVEGSRINLWEVVVEELNLAIDPYPRAPGGRLDEDLQGDHALGEPNRPFAGLEALLKQRKS